MNESAVHLLWQRCQKSEDKEKTAEPHQSSFCGIGAESEARIRCHHKAQSHFLDQGSSGILNSKFC
jgi:hypothetical protein